MTLCKPGSLNAKLNDFFFFGWLVGWLAGSTEAFLFGWFRFVLLCFLVLVALWCDL